MFVKTWPHSIVDFDDDISWSCDHGSLDHCGMTPIDRLLSQIVQPCNQEKALYTVSGLDSDHRGSFERQ